MSPGKATAINPLLSIPKPALMPMVQSNQPLFFSESEFSVTSFITESKHQVMQKVSNPSVMLTRPSAKGRNVDRYKTAAHNDPKEKRRKTVPAMAKRTVKRAV